MSDLPGVSIEGFFKCSVDGEKEIDGKLLPWTLVDYVKQTAQDAQNARQADSDLPREYTVCRGVREKKQSRLKLGMAKRKVNQAFPEDWANWFKKYSMRHKVRIVFLQRRNDLRRIFSVEANRRIPVYATKDAKEATKDGGSQDGVRVNSLFGPRPDVWMFCFRTFASSQPLVNDLRQADMEERTGQLRWRPCEDLVLCGSEVCMYSLE
ncbi:Uncharacterized protein SCF082_LOCUS4632 [Durusdinium trenchii]|uniref:Uncharacterized protein n=1 Tax=Durusdinium trenchii TaxID=1381693 RepID=A0ABP0I288_9DINO